MPSELFGRVFRLVQIATVTVFLGRAWQHLYWDAPYRALLWDENWLRAIVEGWFKTPWPTYVTSSDVAIQNLIQGMGWFYAICSLAAIFIKKLPRIFVVLLITGSVGLIFLAALYSKEKFFHAGQFLEYALQWGSPLFLVVLLRAQSILPRLLFWMQMATAVTFVCHGLYAIDYYPRPVEFIEMTMRILHIDEQQAALFLKIAGILDFTAAALLFAPGVVGAVGLAYCVVWGFLTTLARLWAHFNPDFIESWLLQWLHESILRFPHFLIPLALLLWQVASNRKHFRQF